MLLQKDFCIKIGNYLKFNGFTEKETDYVDIICQQYHVYKWIEINVSDVKVCIQTFLKSLISELFKILKYKVNDRIVFVFVLHIIQKGINCICIAYYFRVV